MTQNDPDPRMGCLGFNSPSLALVLVPLKIYLARESSLEIDPPCLNTGHAVVHEAANCIPAGCSYMVLDAHANPAEVS